MKNKIFNIVKKYIILFIAVVAIVYLTFSFIVMDLNPANWAMEQRSISVFCMAMSFMFSILLTSLKKEIDDN